MIKVLFDPLMEPKQILPLQVWVDWWVISMKMYSTFLKALGLQPADTV